MALFLYIALMMTDSLTSLFPPHDFHDVSAALGVSSLRSPLFLSHHRRVFYGVLLLLLQEADVKAFFLILAPCCFPALLPGEFPTASWQALG